MSSKKCYVFVFHCKTFFLHFATVTLCTNQSDPDQSNGAQLEGYSTQKHKVAPSGVVEGYSVSERASHRAKENI